MGQSVKNLLVEIIGALFILLFTYAALSKLEDIEKFRVQLGKSPLISAFAGLIAWVVPFIEILISILLAVKKFQLLGFYASFSLMIIFSAYIIAILKFSQFIPCSCGGILQNMTWTEHLLFNIGFVLLGAAGIIVYPSGNNRFISK